MGKRRTQKTTYLIVRSRNPRLPPGTILRTSDRGLILYGWTFNPETGRSELELVGIRVARIQLHLLVDRLERIREEADKLAQIANATPEEIEKAVDRALEKIRQALQLD